MDEPTSTGAGERLRPDGVRDVVVVGAGLAGLTAAVTAAARGASVELVEARDSAGGRARSDETRGFVVNHGAHALYRTGAGTAVLKDLGVTFRGSLPRQGGMGWWIDGHRVPARNLAAAGGIDGVRTMRRLLAPGSRGREIEGLSMARWLDRHVPDRGRDLSEMLLRTSCYAADFDTLDAAAGLGQLARGARGVLYLDGGWRSIVSGLEEKARSAGVVHRDGRVEAVRPEGDVIAVELRGGRTLLARSVVLAVGGPSVVDSLVGGASPTIAAWAGSADPIVAACLDVAVERSPRRGPVSTYGLGSPVYLVDHSRSARLAPDGGAVLHALFYEPDRQPDVDHRAVLEAMVDEQDPGWRERAVSVAYRKRAVVAHDRVRPGHAAARPSVTVPELEGVFVAGDWLTGHGMLADAPITSGAEAGAAAALAASPRTNRADTGAAVLGAVVGPSEDSRQAGFVAS